MYLIFDNFTSDPDIFYASDLIYKNGFVLSDQIAELLGMGIGK